MLQVLEQRLPAACGDDHEEAAVLLKPMEVHGGAVENAAPLPSQGRSLLQPLRAGLSAKLMLGAYLAATVSYPHLVMQESFMCLA